MDAPCSTAVSDSPHCWPDLPYNSWKDTQATLHMWLQIAGKVQLALTPRVNQWWNVALLVNQFGLRSTPIPYGHRSFEMEFDFNQHKLIISTNDPATRSIDLAPRTVADFYQEFISALKALKIDVDIWKMPVEIADPIAFDKDTVHKSYDRDAVEKLWRILLSTDAVFKVFRSRFEGKSSPVHFFWGSFDLAVTRFSGKKAPPRNDPDPVLRKIMQEAYSHEVISAGWWPGTDELNGSAFYCYAAPEPKGFKESKIRPPSGYYHAGIGEFVLPYESINKAASPSAALLDFLQSTYEASAISAGWNRDALERHDATADAA
jgi:Family of unknown function (DUF5996)